MRARLEALGRLGRLAGQRLLTIEPLVLITLLGALLMAVLGLGELVGLNPPAAGTPSLIFDLLLALLFAALGSWMLRRPASMLPRWLMIGLVSLGFGVALFTIKLPGIMVFLISAPVLIAILATGRLYPILGYPLILALSLAANPVARLVITPLMATLQLILFVALWNLHARVGLAARRQAEAEATLRQEQEARAFVRFFAHEIKGYAGGLAGLAPLLTELVRETSAGRVQGERVLAAFNQVVGETNTLMEQLLLLSSEGVLSTQQYRPIPLAPLLGRLLDEVGLLAQSLDITLCSRLEVPDEHTVHGQPVYLALALGSALRNALEAAAQAHQAQLGLRVRVWTAGQEQVIRLEDSGPGFPAEALAALRAPEAQLLSGWSSKAGGGLGLPLLLQVARVHQGRLLAGNTARGAWLELRLPAR